VSLQLVLLLPHLHIHPFPFVSYAAVVAKGIRLLVQPGTNIVLQYIFNLQMELTNLNKHIV
jgi:hypothetical protein